MTGETCYYFSDTDAGIKGLIVSTLSFRSQGFRTYTRMERVSRFVLHKLTVIAPKHPSRKERGLFC